MTEATTEAMTDAEREARRRAQLFVAALEVLCELHGVDLDHEDSQGRFVLRVSDAGEGEVCGAFALEWDSGSTYL